LLPIIHDAAGERVMEIGHGLLKRSFRRLALVCMFGVLVLVGGAANAKVIVFDLTEDDCVSSCGLPIYGAVAITDRTAGGVNVYALLVPGVDFVRTDSLSGYALAFSVIGGPNLAITNLATDEFSVGDDIGGTPDIDAGSKFGSFTYGIACTACGVGGTDPKHGPIHFDIADPSITTALFTDGIDSSSKRTGIYFVANIVGPGGSGVVGAGPGEEEDRFPPLPAPEPATLAIFGVALVGALAFRRKRRSG
jgi:hypothetical protein